MLGSRRASISTFVLDFEQRQGRVALEHSTLLHSPGLSRPIGALSTRRLAACGLAALWQPRPSLNAVGCPHGCG